MHLPRLIVTGSSGFVGRHLLDRLKERYSIVGLARRSQRTCGAPVHPNIEWHQVDIGDRPTLAEVFRHIRRSGMGNDAGDVVIHLAAHYDFTGHNDPEYARTNVIGLRNVLEECTALRMRRFVFSSSLAACAFPAEGHALDEHSPPDGRHIYAVTKALGETMLGEYRDRFPSTIIRFAALFSDWCEYPPMFMFLRTWLSRAWNNRVLGGRGQSAIPYLHVRDAARFLDTVVQRIDVPAPGEVLICSVDELVSHGQLFDAATEFYFGSARSSLHVPRVLCLPGIWAQMLVGSLLGEPPFERTWMVRYIDQRMYVDSRRTRERLDWAPRERLALLRRLPFLLENFKLDPEEWNRRNHAAMKSVQLRPNLKVHRLIERHEPRIVEEVTDRVLGRNGHEGLESYRRLGLQHVRWSMRLVLRQLMAAVLTRERGIYFKFCGDLAEERFGQGFEAREVTAALEEIHRTCLEILRDDPDAADVRGFLEEYVTMTMRFGTDAVIDRFERLRDRAQKVEPSAEVSR